MIVTLSNSRGETHQLHYRIRNKASAARWAQCLHGAIPSGLHEKNRFYNFPNQETSRIESLLGKLDELVARLKIRHPEIEFPSIQTHRMQESVNDLHVNYVHGRYKNWVTEETESTWSEFNIVLHAIESYLNNQKTISKCGLPAARIAFTWNDHRRVPLSDEDYEDFTLAYQFGTAYALYSQAGRHLIEMFQAGDDDLPDEHIQPYRFMSANTLLNFGPDWGHFYAEKVYQDIQSWFKKREERFRRLGLLWGDPNLALGRLPVAKLEDAPVSKREIDEFQRFLSRFTVVQAVEIR
jgi:hypothetical protein